MLEETPLENTCPLCGYHSDVAATTSGKHHKPLPGDFNVCIECGALTTFDENLKLVIPTLDAVLELQTKAPNQWKIVNKVQAFIKNRGPIRRD